MKRDTLPHQQNEPPHGLLVPPPAGSPVLGSPVLGSPALAGLTLSALAALASLPACGGRAALAPRERVAASERLTRAGDLAEAEAILWPGLRDGSAAPADRARLLVQLGSVRMDMFWRWDIRPDLAAEPIDEALALADRLADARAADADADVAGLRADAHDAAAMLAYTLKIFRHEGDWDAIDRGFARALALARDDGRRATIRFHLGLVRQMRGDMVRAGDEFAASLALARAAGNDPIAGEDLRHLAYLADTRGERARAIALFRESLRMRQRMGNPPGEATAHLALGEVLLDAGDLTAARQHLEPAYRLARRLGLGYAQVAAAAALARLEVRAGRPALAQPLVERATLVARDRRDDEDLTRASLAAAEVSAALGQPAAARAHLDEARRAAGRSGDPDLARACDDTARRLGPSAAPASSPGGSS
ncbi:MAG TPA: tetratricopeptide repeat protein [Kofleriaceae bacterium]|nr:tetratricopeptide repeat protein [Kofleriaceae bacterium]